MSNLYVASKYKSDIINLLYKMVDITPTNFPLLGIGFAIPLLWFIVFLLSWGGTFIMLKVPGINSLL